MKFTKSSPDSILKNRTVIPRWKPPKQAIEVSSFAPGLLLWRKASGSPWIKHLTSTYEQFPSPYTANELYETALMYGSVEELPPSVFEMSKQLRSSVVSSHIAQTHYLVPVHLQSTGDAVGDAVDAHDKVARLEIHRLRRQLADNPDRPFGWSELARNFLVVGEKDKAIRCMHAALKLVKNNRYLCRAATRLFVHVKDVDRALGLLKSEPTLKHDPWLLSAEIAASSVAHKQSRYLDVAKRLVTSNTFTDNQISELAAALGTVELLNGSNKRAKIMFSKSLIAPTDNSLAQAQWAVEQDSKIIIPQTAWETPASYEAKTLALRQSHDWERALQTCAAWLADEPFSTRPAMIGSYLGFRPEHALISEKFATAGLRSDNSNTALLNNRAVARVYQGKIDDAYTDIQEALMHGSGREDAHLMATLGLIAFRSGMPELGRELYEMSINWFLQSKNRVSVFSAMLYLLREEMRIDQASIPLAKDIAQRVVRSPIVMHSPELVGLAELVLEEALAAENTGNIRAITEHVAPASPEEFNHFASLFHIPEKAKHRQAHLMNYPDLLNG